jgi:hypothetical protein
VKPYVSNSATGQAWSDRANTHLFPPALASAVLPPSRRDPILTRARLWLTLRRRSGSVRGRRLRGETFLQGDVRLVQFEQPTDRDPFVPSALHDSERSRAVRQKAQKTPTMKGARLLPSLVVHQEVRTWLAGTRDRLVPDLGLEYLSLIDQGPVVAQDALAYGVWERLGHG